MSDLEPIKKSLPSKFILNKTQEDIRNNIYEVFQNLSYKDITIIAIKNNRLTIKTQNSAQASNINLQKKEILTDINKHLAKELQIINLTILTG